MDQWTRRRLLQVGSLGALGLSLPRLLKANEQAGETPARRPAKSCILFFLEGGPAHQDLWDMKPHAPREYRGDFRPIATSVPDLFVCEHLPLLARQMHHVALVRSVHHQIVDHNAGAYYALTGRSPSAGGRLILGPEPTNFPPFGAVLSRLRPTTLMPASVQLPDVMSNNGQNLPGQDAGFLGTTFDPLVAGDPSSRKYEPPGLSLRGGLSPERVLARRKLAGLLEDSVPRIDSEARFETAGARLDIHYDRAYELLASLRVRQAFDLSREAPETRARYGLPDRVDRSVEARKFGGLPHLGQCMLLARRLVESGVRLVTVCSGRRLDQAWDTHRDHFPLLKRSLLPYADRALSALLDDLHERGLLEETLVVAMGEFGRTPRLGQITSGAGAAAEGRDHWPHCYTVLLAGGGLRGGAVYGASDKHAAYPQSLPVTPEDIAATIYQALGIPPETRLHDALGRPQDVALGEPLWPLWS